MPPSRSSWPGSTTTSAPSPTCCSMRRGLGWWPGWTSTRGCRDPAEKVRLPVIHALAQAGARAPLGLVAAASRSDAAAGAAGSGFGLATAILVAMVLVLAYVLVAASRMGQGSFYYV